MLRLTGELPGGQRFDAVVVDESQDFAGAWWPALLAALRDEETGGVYAFTDEGQVVFARYGRPPVPLVPIVLDHNMRNTRQIGEVFKPDDADADAPGRRRRAGGALRRLPAGRGDRAGGRRGRGAARAAVAAPATWRC
jgi:hypothetical protein